MDLEQKAIERLKTASDMSMRLYKQPLVITYSGGKDSEVLLRLAEVSKIPYEVSHSLTTADAPETVKHVYDTLKKQELKGVKCTVDKHTRPDGARTTMWNLIVKNAIPPTRWRRYCCKALKEGSIAGRFIATGVRWSESSARKKNRGNLEIIASKKSKNLILLDDNDENRRLFESCQLKGKRVVNPIVDWTDNDVWNYISEQKIKMNPLYCEGFKRVGCIGCPMANTKDRIFGLERYPKIKAAYIRAFDKMLEKRKKIGAKDCGFESGIDVYHDWMEDGILPGQIALKNFENEQEGKNK